MLYKHLKAYFIWATSLAWWQSAHCTPIIAIGIGCLSSVLCHSFVIWQRWTHAVPTLCGDYHYFQKYIWSHLNVVHCVLSVCQIRYKFVLYLINSFLNQITANVERNISNSLYKIIRRSVHISGSHSYLWTGISRFIFYTSDFFAITLCVAYFVW